MGLFGQSTPFEADIEKATSEKNTSEPWGVIMDICDKLTSNPRNAKECLRAIMKRMGHPDPHVVIQAITLLDACVNNCGKSFHLEVASREFENEFKRLLSKVQPQVATKMRMLLKKWAENDFKSDPQLNLIPSLYHKLKSEGHDFTDVDKKPKSVAPIVKDPNVVTSQQEEEDIAKAIELSLKEAKSSPKKTSTTSYPALYPAFSANSSIASSVSGGSAAEARKVRALYDFEAAEDNELTFSAGEIIFILDDSDPNWWKGYNQRGEGLFPSNFVTADLSVEPEKLDINQKTKKSVQFEDELNTSINETEDRSNGENKKQFVPEINEEKIDRLLHLLHEANPEDPSQDSDEMLRLEEEVNQMGPLIDAELERVDRKHAQLTQLSSDLVDAINLYHQLMREPDRTTNVMGYFPSYNSGPNLYGGHSAPPPPASLPYSIPNMYQPPNSHPPMMMSGPPGQIMMNGNTIPGSGSYVSQSQQMGPQMNYHNGQQHSVPPPPPSQQMQQSPQNQQPSSQSQPQSISNSMSAVNQQQQQQQLQQQPPPVSQNTSVISTPPLFLPPSVAGIYSSPQMGAHFAGPMGPIPPFQTPSQLPPVINSSGGPMNGPQSLPPYINQQNMQIHPSLASVPPHLAAINQPVTQTILGQNDPKTNIPIFQQQR